MAPEGGQFGFPSAIQWKGVSDLVTSIFGGPTKGVLLTNSIITSMVIAGIVGLVFEIARIASKNKFPISALAIGLGVVVPPESTFMMFCGAGFFWLMNNLYSQKKESTGWRLWVDTQEPICAGIIAGAALVGIGDVLVKVFALAPLG
ncbi:MAG: OPT/YSL family transporter, partial [Phycisphaerales bacterium]